MTKKLNNSALCGTLIALAAGWAVTPALAQTTPTAPAPAAATQANADAEFVHKVAIGGMLEVQMGRYAETHARSPAVRVFGRWMDTDHTLAGQLLTQAAQHANIPVPTALDDDHQKMATHLESLSGPAFDREYVSAMVNDHKETVADFKTAASSASNPAVRAFAAQIAPVVEQHLTGIEDIQSELYPARQAAAERPNEHDAARHTKQ